MSGTSKGGRGGGGIAEHYKGDDQCERGKGTGEGLLKIKRTEKEGKESDGPHGLRAPRGGKGKKNDK